jgi:hypothetical protein
VRTRIADDVKTPLADFLKEHPEDFNFAVPENKAVLERIIRVGTELGVPPDRFFTIARDSFSTRMRKGKKND